jgi:tetratricopeptide (TPR) repeat protein/TolB-like protein
MTDAPRRDRDSDTAEVERLLEQAASLPAPDREAFLNAECPDRPDLHAEVLSLLGHAAAAEAFFERLDVHVPPSVAALAGTVLPSPEDLPPGSRIGRYRLLERLGAGGMGAVYRAYDESLDRDVALKLVPRHLASDPDVRARFLVEARAAASLDHPNICTIHEVADTAEGRPFLAMTCYRGETLKDRLDRGAIPVDEALTLAREIVRGLAAAHQRGVVHRDVKPGNVMLVDDGSVKILDFGIAKVADGTLTGPGLTPGTVAYMSPEQARGEEVDHRSDLWSVGVVLYEMIAGQRPFRGTQDGVIIHAILHTEPPPLEELKPGTPEGVARMVERLLRKAPPERYPDADGLLADLEEAVAGGGDARRAPPDRGQPFVTPRAGSDGTARASRRQRIAVALAVMAIVGVGLTAIVAPWAGRQTRPEPDPSVVAVLPFRVAAADSTLAFLREGMLDLLAVKLAGAERLTPVDPRTVLDAWQRAGGGEGDLARNDALDLARGLGAGRLLLGEVVSLPGRVVVTASLHEVVQRTAGPAVAVEGPADSVPSLIDEFAVRLLSGQAGQGVPLASVSTGSLPAARQYLEGQAAYRRGQYDDAVRRFWTAVELDSTFALAALMAWRAGTKAGSGVAPQQDPLARAWRHRHRLGPAERSYVDALLGPDYPDRSGQARMLAARHRLVSDHPDHVEAWFSLGETIPHTMARAGVDPVTTLRRTAGAFQRALALDSAFMPAVTQLQLTHSALGDTAEAFRYARLYLGRVPDGLEADKLRCVLLATSVGAVDLVPQLDSFAPASVGRCLMDLHGFHPYASAARDSVAAYLDRRSGDPEVLVRNLYMMYTIAHDRGRPSEARRHGAAYLRSRPWSTAFPAALIRDALHWDGDQEAAKQAAVDLDSWLNGVRPEAADMEQVEAACALGQWHVATEQYRAAAAIIDRLRAIGGSARSVLDVEAIHCAALLDAWSAFATGAEATDARVAALDRLLTDGGREARLIRESGLLLARIYEAAGDPARALHALERSHFARPDFYASSHLRERGRLAAMIGDTAAAINAYRRYLARRSAPEPALRAEVERVRRELELLGG